LKLNEKKREDVISIIEGRIQSRKGREKMEGGYPQGIKTLKLKEKKKKEEKDVISEWCGNDQIIKKL